MDARVVTFHPIILSGTCLKIQSAGCAQIVRNSHNLLSSSSRHPSRHRHKTHHTINNLDHLHHTEVMCTTATEVPCVLQTSIPRVTCSMWKHTSPFTSKHSATEEFFPASDSSEVQGVCEHTQVKSILNASNCHTTKATLLLYKPFALEGPRWICLFGLFLDDTLMQGTHSPLSWISRLEKSYVLPRGPTRQEATKQMALVDKACILSCSYSCWAVCS